MYVLELVASSPTIRNLYTDKRANFATDAGFDLYCPVSWSIPPHSTLLIDLGVSGRMLHESDASDAEEVSYMLVPRSSIIKTPLLLHNSIGIIDIGYRNTIKAAFRNTSNEMYTIEANTRLVQLIVPSLAPFHVKWVDELPTSERGEGGFGSTGK